MLQSLELPARPDVDPRFRPMPQSPWLEENLPPQPTFEMNHVAQRNQ